MVLLGLACGRPAAPSSTAGARAPGGATLACPAPIGAIPAESCADIADDFGALTVQGALSVAGTGKGAEQRLSAIREVGALAQSIKDQRVELCQRYNRCKVPVAERDAQDKVLSEAMRSLIDLWNKRRIAGPEEVARFRAAVLVIDRRVNGGVESGPPAPPPPRTLDAEAALARVADPGVVFRAQSGSVGVSATAAGQRDALLGKPEAISLAAGHRYRIRVSGAYQPA